MLVTAVGILDGVSLRDDGAVLGCELKDDGTSDATNEGRALGFEESVADGVVLTCTDGVSVVTSDGFSLGLLLKDNEGLTDGDPLTVEGKLLGNILGILEGKLLAISEGVLLGTALNIEGAVLMTSDGRLVG